MIHHGDQEIQEDDNVDDRVSAEHQHAPESGEHFDAVQLEALEIHQAEDRPKERLRGLKQTVERRNAVKFSFIKCQFQQKRGFLRPENCFSLISLVSRTELARFDTSCYTRKRGVLCIRNIGN